MQNEFVRKLTGALRVLQNPVYGIRRFLYEIYRLTHPNKPWIAQGATRFCERLLTKDMQVFEWGSGASTTWFAHHAGRVVSIEYDETWFKLVQERLKQQHVKNVDCRYISLEHPIHDPTPHDYDPLPHYVSVINEFPENHFDCILIDGHYRLACVPHAVKRLRLGGHLVIDNSNRSRLEEWQVPADWPLLHQSSNPVTETSIWLKIS